ncbi:MAG: carbonate dehydratase [Trueperaceae bacterium]
MRKLHELFEGNRRWSERMRSEQPGAFAKMAAAQRPEYLWIGCSDSRVPANQILDLPPGEVFVHRNIANVVPHSDMNVLSVLEYAVEVLLVKHVIVCGHYGCGGVEAALAPARPGMLVDNWLRHVRDVAHRHRRVLDSLPPEARARRLAELNSLAQARNVCHTSIVQSSWAGGRELTVHAWVYGLDDGLLRDLEFSVSSISEVDLSYRVATGSDLGGAE